MSRTLLLDQVVRKPKQSNPKLAKTIEKLKSLKQQLAISPLILIVLRIIPAELKQGRKAVQSVPPNTANIALLQRPIPLQHRISLV